MVLEHEFIKIASSSATIVNYLDRLSV